MSKTQKSRVILRSVAERPIASVVRECMDLCGWDSWVGRDAIVVIKPNLCTFMPDRAEAANTSVTVARAVCEVLLNKTSRIFIGESDGMRHTANDGFEVSGYTRLARELGITLVNFTKSPCRSVTVQPAGEVELPRLLLECDAFMTLPVLKTHGLTYFTGALKNQWGCIPQYDRIILHRYLHAMLPSLNAIFRPRMALMDAIVAMEGHGPVNGNPRPMDLLLASCDPVALDSAAMRLVGLHPHKARHVELAAKQRQGRIQPQEIELDGDWDRYASQFKPGSMDWANAAEDYMSRYRWFVKLFLESDTIYYPIRAFVRGLRRLGFSSEAGH